MTRSSDPNPLPYNPQITRRETQYRKDRARRLRESSTESESSSLQSQISDPGEESDFSPPHHPIPDLINMENQNNNNNAPPPPLPLTLEDINRGQPLGSHFCI